jgi:hypothetical protein
MTTSSRRVQVETTSTQSASDSIDVTTLERRTQSELNGVITGRVVGASATGSPEVEYIEGAFSYRRPARTVVAPHELTLGTEVVLMFEHADPMLPLIMGVLHPATFESSLVRQSRELCAKTGAAADVDGEPVVLEGRRQVALRCGKSSITLHPDGKIVIRGTDLISRATGTNKIKGASVRLN